MERKVIIIGGGLTGLTLAYLLHKKNRSFTVLEASDRLGGRIHTIQGTNGTPLELGATWFSDVHPNLKSLISDLGIEKFPQFSSGISLFQTKSFEPAQQFFIPGSEQPSYRIAGGSQQLIELLSRHIPKESVVLDSHVIRLEKIETGIQIITKGGEQYQADQAVLCIPPQLAGRNISFRPELPEPLVTLMPTVQTWMAGAIKFVLEYNTPFWRNNGFSGMLYSHAGIITEMYDHTNLQEDRFGFTGFLNGSSAGYAREVRRELVIAQLTELLGHGAANPAYYQDKVWNGEHLIAEDQAIQRPHQNNGHPMLSIAYLNGSLFFCGTECATVYPGYMEGAVNAAIQMTAQLTTE